MARVDSLESQKAAGNFKTVISGTKLLRFVPSGIQYSCVKSSEIKVSSAKAVCIAVVLASAVLRCCVLLYYCCP